MNASSVIFDPAFDWPVLWIAGGIVAAILIFAIWRGLKGWALRMLGAAALLLALAGPSLQMEERAPEGDIMLAIVDESASQGLSDRAEQTEAALNALTARVAATEGLELRITRMSDGEDNRGSLLMTTLAEALAEVPRDRVAGMVLISDGRLHDLEAARSAADRAIGDKTPESPVHIAEIIGQRQEQQPPAQRGLAQPFFRDERKLGPRGRGKDLFQRGGQTCARDRDDNRRKRHAAHLHAHQITQMGAADPKPGMGRRHLFGDKGKLQRGLDAARIDL